MEQVAFSLAHTVFLPKDSEPINSIENIACEGIVLGRSKNNGIISLNGELSVQVEYTAPNNEQICQTLSFPWQEEMPGGFSGFDPDEMSLLVDVLDYQILLDDAFEVMLSLKVQPKEHLGSPNFSEQGRKFAEKFAELENAAASATLGDVDDEFLPFSSAAEKENNSDVVAQTDGVTLGEENIDNSVTVNVEPGVDIENSVAVNVTVAENIAVSDIAVLAENSMDESADDVLTDDVCDSATEASASIEGNEDNKSVDGAAVEAAAERETEAETEGKAVAVDSFVDDPMPRSKTETIGNEYRMRFYLTHNMALENNE